jgi:hypothetical protein
VSVSVAAPATSRQVVNKAIAASTLSMIQPSGRFIAQKSGSDSNNDGSNLAGGRDALASQKELFTIFSFNDAFFPIHIEVKLGRPAGGQAAERRVFSPTP